GWSGPAMGNANLEGSLPLVAKQLYLFFTGSYYLGWPLASPGPATTAFAIGSCALLAGATILQVYRVATRQYCALSHLLFATVCATLAGEWILLPARDARYFLPLSAPFVALAGVELADLVDRGIVQRRAAVGLALAMLVLGSASLVEFRRFNF